MKNPTIVNIETGIRFIENHMDGKLNLDMVANAVHYYKYHLHAMVTETFVMTTHDYA
ncbi:hypothetical protein [Anaerotignum sp.]|uniref:hypothetical protein n=1 Tax=Anaerotignum sp. TaxID=2039241 RepID=UPI0027147180|nr:hypothetical protein [Anaerotignum sp.]